MADDQALHEALETWRSRIKGGEAPVLAVLVWESFEAILDPVAHLLSEGWGDENGLVSWRAVPLPGEGPGVAISPGSNTVYVWGYNDTTAEFPCSDPASTAGLAVALRSAIDLGVIVHE